MPHAVATVRVADFDRFIQTFETRGKAKRAEHGSRSAVVYRSAEDPQEVIVFYDWDREGIEAFLADPEAREIMAEAGLQGPPEFNFVVWHEDLDA
jgi:quinol monooxygenase YgiN